MEIPELGDSDTVERVKQQSKTLVPWLPDPFECPECNIYCDATISYDPQMVEYTDSWVCPECSQAYYRDSM